MKSYFELRNVSPDAYDHYSVPRWLQSEIERLDNTARILDFGCGFGQFIGGLKRLGYSSVEGADVDAAAIAHCHSIGHRVHNLKTDDGFYSRNIGEFDAIVTQHVLEHIAKEAVIEVVEKLRGLLAPGGILLVAVPNAQAFTGSYWAYEDFTHHTLYTSGSAYYVLRSAGFNDIRFLDVDCTAGLSLPKRLLRRTAWLCYRTFYLAMCGLMASRTHISSPDIFSYEIKVAAKTGITGQ